MDTQGNIPLLRKAVEWAESEALKPAELREWDQRQWVIPTSADDPNAEDAKWHAEVTAELRREKAPECGTCYCIAGFVASQVGPVKASTAAAIASERLGLTADASYKLFAATNSIEDVRRIAEEIAGERL